MPHSSRQQSQLSPGRRREGGPQPSCAKYLLSPGRHLSRQDKVLLNMPQALIEHLLCMGPDHRGRSKHKWFELLSGFKAGSYEGLTDPEAPREMGDALHFIIKTRPRATLSVVAIARLRNWSWRRQVSLAQVSVLYPLPPHPTPRRGLSTTQCPA